MATIGQFNVNLLPIDIQRRLKGNSSLQANISTQAAPWIIRMVCYDTIKRGDVVGIINNTRRNSNYILTNPSFADITPNNVLALKQDAVLYPFYDIGNDFLWDIKTLGIALMDGNNKDIIDIQTAFEYDYSGIRISNDDENIYDWIEGADCYLVEDNKITQSPAVADYQKLIKLGVATAPTRLLITIEEHYLKHYDRF